MIRTWDLWAMACREPVSLTTLGSTLLAAGTAAGAGAAGAAVSSAAASKSSKPTLAPAPEPQKTVKMPDEEDPRVKAERDRRLRERQMAGGRDSTNLTSADYGGSVLGS